jgi:hypothetical protein
LEASTNVSHWILLLSTNSATPVFEWIDPESANVPRRFYRAVTE